jgi:siroheme synthase (precorrin-2 oxidase/ferrochelatase)
MTKLSRCVLVVVVCILAERRSDAQAQAAQGRDTTYVVITKGVLGTPIFPIRFESAPLNIGVRNFVMGPGEAQRIPVTVRTIMELRGGMVTTTINGESRERRAGDFWVVEPGSSISLVNRGDVAVIRVLHLQERQ